MNAPAPAAADWEAWSCRVRVVVTDPAALDEARAVLAADLAAVDLACSRFRSDSELAAVEAVAGTWVEVSPLLADLLDVGLRAARITDGDVDPTVGAALAGLGYDRDLAAISPGGVIVRAAVPGWRRIELDRATGRARIAPGVRVDLGATAKA
ncbi:MAG: thiamine biosynthesis protein, partial [Frankiales bacterium]|nr:thiamine biosynthesis protein [Frankiales bacterium]